MKGLRLDQLQLDWIEGYAAKSGLNFSGVVRLAITHFIESEFTKMNDLDRLFEALDWQIRKVEAVVLDCYNPIRIAGTGPTLPDREIVAKHERLVLYDQAIAMLHTLLAIAESKEAAANPEIKIDSLLAANALTRTAEAIMNDYERSVTEAHLKQMRDYIERLRQASGEGAKTG